MSELKRNRGATLRWHLARLHWRGQALALAAREIKQKIKIRRRGRK